MNGRTACALWAALTELFNEVKTSETPIMVERVVTDIDEIVRLVWCLKSKHQIIELAARATDARMVSALLCHTKGFGS